MSEFVEPVDETHAMSVESVRQIRQHAARLRAAVARWEPRPYVAPTTIHDYPQNNPTGRKR